MSGIFFQTQCITKQLTSSVMWPFDSSPAV